MGRSAARHGCLSECRCGFVLQRHHDTQWWKRRNTAPASAVNQEDYNMAKKQVQDSEVQIQIQPITMGRAGLWLLGGSTLIVHRYASKAWRELLMPSQKKNAAAKAANLKHDPLEEFQQCLYLNRDPSEPTLLHFPAGAFSKAMASAALDLPGASKSQILRLVNLSSIQVNLYGLPSLGMSMVRNSDMKHTPDVRTRAYMKEWACFVEIEYVKSLIDQSQIFNLVGAAGLIVGIGDWRPQKGGQYGKFVNVSPDDPRLLEVLKQKRKAQEAAFRSPTFFDQDSRDLYEWFTAEVTRREKTLASDDDKPKKTRKPRKGDTGNIELEMR
jgi:hypothetical protein